MKSLNEGDDNSPKCMVVFSWLIILSGKNTLADSLIHLKRLLGLVMLAGVIMIMGELIMDWSLKNFSTTRVSQHLLVQGKSCDCKCL